MEDGLLLREWGRYARTAWFRTQYPEWVKAMTGRRRETPKTYIGDIDPDYAAKLDRNISGLDEQQRDVLVNIYVNRLSVRDTAKDLGISRQSVCQSRDISIAYLYGRLID
jgi:DNA-directed RNA polymerase specialized sigma subunit